MVTKDNISQKYQLYVPVEGRRHDVTMLRMSGLMPVLENFLSGLSMKDFVYMEIQHTL